MTRDYVVVLDACTLVGGGLRDTILRLAETPKLYIPKWSDDIIAETIRTLETRFNRTPDQTRHLREQLQFAFPEAWVHGYKPLEQGLTNHPKDRHGGCPRFCVRAVPHKIERNAWNRQKKTG
jgi:hypothetical protein